MRGTVRARLWQFTAIVVALHCPRAWCEPGTPTALGRWLQTVFAVQGWATQNESSAGRPAELDEVAVADGAFAPHGDRALTVFAETADGRDLATRRYGLSLQDKALERQLGAAIEESKIAPGNQRLAIDLPLRGNLLFRTLVLFGALGRPLQRETHEVMRNRWQTQITLADPRIAPLLPAENAPVRLEKAASLTIGGTPALVVPAELRSENLADLFRRGAIAIDGQGQATFDEDIRAALKQLRQQLIALEEANLLLKLEFHQLRWKDGQIALRRPEKQDKWTAVAEADSLGTCIRRFIAARRGKPSDPKVRRHSELSEQQFLRRAALAAKLMWQRQQPIHKRFSDGPSRR